MEIEVKTMAWSNLSRSQKAMALKINPKSPETKIWEVEVSSDRVIRHKNTTK